MADTNNIQQVFLFDGRHFNSRAEVIAYQRRPKILEALTAFIGSGESQDKLKDWLIENQEAVEVAFEAGTIKRVTKAETNKLTKAFDALKEAAEKDHVLAKNVAFLVENAEAAITSFRWPSVKRMDDAQKTEAALASLTAATEGNEKLATFIVENKDPILEAYKAGIEKRAVSPNATNALAEYRARMAAEKAAREAAAADAETSTAA